MASLQAMGLEEAPTFLDHPHTDVEHSPVQAGQSHREESNLQVCCISQTLVGGKHQKTSYIANTGTLVVKVFPEGKNKKSSASMN